jgi:hypothetical protein
LPFGAEAEGELADDIEVGGRGAIIVGRESLSLVTHVRQESTTELGPGSLAEDPRGQDDSASAWREHQPCIRSHPADGLPIL